MKNQRTILGEPLLSKKGIVALWIRSLIQWLTGLLFRQIPEGYEDEAGFHYINRGDPNCPGPGARVCDPQHIEK
jgi:hypothetical protein